MQYLTQALPFAHDAHHVDYFPHAAAFRGDARSLAPADPGASGCTQSGNHAMCLQIM